MEKDIIVIPITLSPVTAHCSRESLSLCNFSEIKLFLLFGGGSLQNKDSIPESELIQHYFANVLLYCGWYTHPTEDSPFSIP